MKGKMEKNIENSQIDGMNYHQLFNDAPIAYQSLDENGCILEVNNLWLDKLGYEREEVIGRWFGDFLHSDMKEIFRAAFKENIKRKDLIKDVEFPLVNKNGHIIYANYTARIGFDENGDFVRTHCVFEDTTSRKNTVKMQKVLYNILEAVATTKDLQDLFNSIHKHLSTILDVKNFYVAFLDEVNDLINFPFYHDEKVIFNSVPAEKTLTKYVIKTNKPLFADEQKQKELHDKGLIGEPDEGTDAKIWIGVPLRQNQKVIGAVSIQSYDDDTAFVLEDMRLLEIVSDTIALAITRKQNVEALQTSEQRLSLALESTNLGLWDLDNKTGKIYRNDIWANMLGYSPDEIKDDLNFFESIVHPDDRPNMHYKSEAAAKDKTAKFDIEHRMRTKDGNWKWIRDWGKVVEWDENNKPVRIIGTHLDIDEEKKMRLAIKESEEKYRSLFENSTDIVFTLDFLGYVTDVNRTLESSTHYRREEILGVSFMSFFSEDVGKKLNEALESVRETGKPVQNLLLDINRRNGDKLYWECSLILMKKNDKPCGFQGILRDVTKRQTAELELLKHQDHIKLINSILRHDIANCFAVINSALNLYKRSQDKSMLDEAALQIKKGISLIGKMKQLEEYFVSRSELKKVNLADILEDIAAQYSSLKTTINGNSIVLADEALESSFDNLFANALKHGAASKIEIEIIPENGKCRISFADNGSGISDDIKEKIFEKAFKSGKTGNTGLGLYIVKKTIDRYGGSIKVEDNEPQGTKFIIELKCMK